MRETKITTKMLKDKPMEETDEPMEQEAETSEVMTVKNIILDGEYSIERDYASWNLKYAKTGEMNEATGKPKVSRQNTYHVNLEHALETYADKAIKPCETLFDVLIKLDEVKEVIKAALIEHAKVVQDSKVIRS